MTSPTASSKAWLRLRDAKNAELKAFCRKHRVSVRRKLHSEAYERGARK
jgi:hypothetical protein